MRLLLAAALIAPFAAAPAQRAPDLQRVATLPVGVGVVTHVAMSPGGKRVALATAAGDIVCVDAISRRIEQRWRAPGLPVDHLQFAGEDAVDIRVGAHNGVERDRSRWLRSAVTGDHSARPHAGIVEVTGDVAAWRERFGAGHDFHGSDVDAVSASEDGTTCVALWNRGWVKVWSNGRVESLVDGPLCQAVTFTADSGWVVAVMQTRILATPLRGGEALELPVVGPVWNVAPGTAGCEFLVFTDAEAIAYHAASRRELWRVPLPERAGVRLPVWGATTSPAGDVVAVRGWYDSTSPAVALLDVAKRTWREYPMYHGSFAWTGDGQMLVVGTGHYGCCVMETDRVRCIPRHPGEVRMLRLPGPGDPFQVPVVCSVPGERWFVASRATTQCLRLDDATPRGPAVALPAGPRLVLAAHWLLGADGATLALHSLPRLEPGPRFRAAAAVDRLVGAPCGDRVVASEPGALEVFELRATRR